MTDDQIKHMVDRFLAWKLPTDFRPDGGVSYSPLINPSTGLEYEPGVTGTCLLTATQATEMVRHMIKGLP